MDRSTGNVLPTESENGHFGPAETYLDTSGEEPVVRYKFNHQKCTPQTLAIRQQNAQPGKPDISDVPDTL